MQESLESAVNELRPGLDADGFEVNIESVTAGGVVTLCIGHRPDCCEECLIPDDMLAAIFKTAMQRVVPSVTAVLLRHEKLSA